MEFPILISWTSPFPFEGLFDGIFYFYFNFDRTFCKHTMDTLIRCCILQPLISVSLFAYVLQKGALYRLIQEICTGKVLVVRNILIYKIGLNHKLL